MNSILNLDNIQKSIRHQPVFNPVAFELAPGAGIAVIGHNGSGKTTLLDIIAGIRRPDAGNVALRAKIGYVMQNDGFQDALSCRDNLLFEAALCGITVGDARKRALYCADICGATDFLSNRLSKCSGGMRARVAMAAALIPEPELLLLDEPFGAIDRETRVSIKGLLMQMKEFGLSFIIVSHDSNDYVGLCERVLSLPESEVSVI